MLGFTTQGIALVLSWPLLACASPFLAGRRLPGDSNAAAGDFADGSHNSNLTNVTNVTRTTWNGCKCKKYWEWPDVATCNTSCCNRENDFYGEWCMVEDRTCEESSWGYCRPTDANATECADSPRGWADAEGDSCGMYGLLQWCTKDGQKGPGWNEDWGKFDKYTNGNKTAMQACCNCGGGFVQDPSCKDYEGWLDLDTDGCQVYKTRNWCQPDGKNGAGWHEDKWGPISNYSVNNVSAVQACCACGGGTKPFATDSQGKATTPAQEQQGKVADTVAQKDVAPLPTQVPVQASDVRVTWNGCECLSQWTFDEEGSGGHKHTCGTTCCNPDSDKEGPWCMVKDASCEDAAWGYCRPREDEEKYGRCTNEPKGWKDSEGDSCIQYMISGWCTTTGGYGDKWDKDWGTFKNYSSNGKSAADVCCQCGGGVKAAPDANCTDKPGWKDPDRDGCVAYEEWRWCDSSGGVGAHWHQDWGSFPAKPGDVNASKACCYCGGGQKAGEPAAWIASTNGARLENEHTGSHTSTATIVGFVVLLLTLIAGALTGLFCYRARKGADVNDLTNIVGAEPGRSTYGRKYQTVEDL